MKHAVTALARGLILALTFAISLPALADRGAAKVKGTISAIDHTAGTFSVAPARGGADVNLSVDGRTVIKINKRHATFSDLSVGNFVETSYDPRTLIARKIEAKTTKPPLPVLAKVEGWIASVDLTQGCVTITPKRGGAPVSVSATSATVIKLNGRSATLADLRTGDKAEAKYDPVTLVAVKIEAKRK